MSKQPKYIEHNSQYMRGEGENIAQRGEDSLEFLCMPPLGSLYLMKQQLLFRSINGLNSPHFDLLRLASAAAA